MIRAHTKYIILSQANVFRIIDVKNIEKRKNLTRFFYPYVWIYIYMNKYIYFTISVEITIFIITAHGNNAQLKIIQPYY